MLKIILLFNFIVYIIFEYLNFSRFEEQLHTPFLRMLLDKDANHGVGKGFLEAFLKMVKEALKLDFQYDVNSSHVEYKDKYSIIDNF